MQNFLSDAFKALESLNEDTFELNDDGVEKYKEFKDEEEKEDDVVVIDPEAEDEEELEDDYVGKVILNCNVCHSMIYKDKDDVKVDEESEDANEEEECPYCYATKGFKVIGEVKDFEEEDDTKVTANDDVDVEVEDKEEKEIKDESLRESRKVSANNNDIIMSTYDRFDIAPSIQELMDVIKRENDIMEMFPNASDEYEAEGILFNRISKLNKKYDLDIKDAYDESLRESRKHKTLRESETDRIYKILEDRGIVDFNEVYPVDGEDNVYEIDYIYRTPEGVDDLLHQFKKANIRAWTDDYVPDYDEDYSPAIYFELDLSAYESLRESHKGYSRKANSKKAIKEAKEVGRDLAKFQKWVDYDMKKYKKISGETKEKLKKAGLEVVKDNHGDYEVIAKEDNGKPIKECDKQSLEEQFDKVVLETEDKVYKIESEDKESAEVSSEEMIEPVSPETKADIEANSDTEEVEEVSEEDFDELGESYLKEVYDNVRKYKTTSIKSVNEGLLIEGIITFKSGKAKKTAFLFEKKVFNKHNNKVRFIGENLQISNNNRAFTLTGTLKGGKLFCEKLTYNYYARNLNEGKSVKLYGTKRLTEAKKDLSKVKGSMTTILSNNISTINKATSKEDLASKVEAIFKENNLDTPASKRLITNIKKERNLIGGLSAVYNSIQAGSGNAVGKN